MTFRENAWFSVVINHLLNSSSTSPRIISCTQQNGCSMQPSRSMCACVCVCETSSMLQCAAPKSIDFAVLVTDHVRSTGEDNGVFPKWSSTFIQFWEIWEITKAWITFSLKIFSVTCVSVVQWYHLSFLHSRLKYRNHFYLFNFFVTVCSEYQWKHLGKTPLFSFCSGGIGGSFHLGSQVIWSSPSPSKGGWPAPPLRWVTYPISPVFPWLGLI